MITTEDKKTKLTYKDYLKMPEDNGDRYELIEGELEAMTSPNFEHQDISSEINDILKGFVKKNKLGKICYAPMDVILDEYLVLQPDIIFISNEKKGIIKDRIYGSPDLVVEILSPTTLSKDVNKKFNYYEKYKIKEYWIVEPSNKLVEIYSLENDKYVLYSKAINVGIIKSKILFKLEVDLKNIFTNE
jgi:Uma2 family endonuclease